MNIFHSNCISRHDVAVSYEHYLIEICQIFSFNPNQKYSNKNEYFNWRYINVIEVDFD
jgi:hypothetical protein